MIKVKLNAEQVQKSLEKFRQDARRKMTGMVREFAYKMAMTAINNTPLGNAAVYPSFYEMRQFWPKEEGMARYNWQFDTVKSFPTVIGSGRDTGIQAATRVQVEVMKYRLGNTFYVGNTLLYIGELERNKSPQTGGMGISKPTMDTILSVYSMQLDQYYKATP